MIEESNTINQLNLALNELLDAYDALKGENDSLIEENTQLKKELEELSFKNETLEKDVSSLNNTTKHHTSEIDSMLGRIKSTLNSRGSNASIQNPVETEKEEDTITSNNDMQTDENSSEQLLQKDEEPKKDENGSNSKEIDLGRMQSLLSGFNS
jgi:FtsZ-binding cell division protein ZapB